MRRQEASTNQRQDNRSTWTNHETTVIPSAFFSAIFFAITRAPMGDAREIGGWLLLCSRSDPTKLHLDEDGVTFILPPGCDDVASAIADGDRLFESWSDGSMRAAHKLRGWRAAAGAVTGDRLGSREQFPEYVDVCLVSDGLKRAIDAITGGADSLDELTGGTCVVRLEPFHVDVFEDALRAADAGRIKTLPTSRQLDVCAAASASASASVAGSGGGGKSRAAGKRAAPASEPSAKARGKRPANSAPKSAVEPTPDPARAEPAEPKKRHCCQKPAQVTADCAVMAARWIKM